MAGLLDWLTDGAVSSPIFGGMASVNSPSGVAAPQGASPMPPVQQTGSDGPALNPPQPNPGAMAPPVDPSTQAIGGGVGGGPAAPSPVDPSTTDLSGGMQGGSPGPLDPSMSDLGVGGAGGPGAQPPVPMPQPRPATAPGPGPIAPGPPGTPPAVNPPNVPPGQPLNIGPGLGLNTPPSAPAQTWLGRALGIAPDQAGKEGQQIMSGIGAGLKSVATNWNKPGLAAFAGSAGAAMEGAEKKADTQAKTAADYLKAAIDARKAGDDAGYKQNYLRYLAAKLQADTDKAASKDSSTANKNDSPTQLYLSAQRLVQPDRNALSKQIAKMRADGEDPATIAKAQTDGEAAINAKLNDHYATLGLHPQTAAQVAQQPGNSQQNPIDAAKAGITKDNAAKKLQPGQYFTNPADGKVYQYKGPSSSSDTSKKTAPAKPTNAEPANPMNKSDVSNGAPAGKSASDDDDDD